MTRTRFDELFDEAAPLIRQQRHQRDTPPVEGGRWPVSVYLPLDDAASLRVDELARQALALAGPGHFGTGLSGCSHVTVRALEPHRHHVPDDDPALARYRSALARAAAQCGPVTLRFTGVTLTPITVMLCAEPVDGVADALAVALRDELGPDGRHEAHFRRDIWYATLVHLADDVADPEGLVAWAAARRRLDVGTTTARTAALAQFRFAGAPPPARMALLPLAAYDLTGAGELASRD